MVRTIDNTTKATAGDTVHQTIAISMVRRGIKASEVVETLKAHNYVVNLKGVTYKVQATSVASIVTGIEIAISVAKGKVESLRPIDNGVEAPQSNTPLVIEEC